MLSHEEVLRGPVHPFAGETDADWDRRCDLRDGDRRADQDPVDNVAELAAMETFLP